MRGKRRSSRGTTLIEVLISLALVMVGMLALFRIIASSIIGSSAASRTNQAQLRATMLLENMRQAPQAALACLASNTPDNWSVCENTCKTTLSGVAQIDGCIYTMASMSSVAAPAVDTLGAGFATNGQRSDRSQQTYSIVYDGTRGSRDTFARVTGANTRIYEIQVSVGWNDSNVVGAISTAATFDHAVTLRTGIFN